MEDQVFHSQNFNDTACEPTHSYCRNVIYATS